jgi:hypothetical protein
MVCADRRGTGTVSGFWIAAYLRLGRPSQAGAMTDKARIKIAAGVTALFLAGISTAGLAVRGNEPQAATTAAAPPSAPTEAPGQPAAGDDRGVAAILQAALAAASGEDRDAAAVIDAVLAAASSEAHGDDDGNESEHDDDE